MCFSGILKLFSSSVNSVLRSFIVRMIEHKGDTGMNKERYDNLNSREN